MPFSESKNNIIQKEVSTTLIEDYLSSDYIPKKTYGDSKKTGRKLATVER